MNAHANHLGGRAAVVAALCAILALLLVGASLPLPGGPLIAALLLLAARGAVRRRPDGALAAQVLLAAVVLAVLVQCAVVATYAVTSGSDQPSPVTAPQP